MATTVTLTGDRVVLRPPRPSDIGERLALGADAGIGRMYGTVQAPELTEAMVRRWYDSVSSAVEPHWVIEHAGRFAGSARLYEIRPAPQRRATYAVGFADPSLIGRGLGTEATRLVLAHAFDTLGLHRVGLRVLAANTRAIACYRRCGFVEEGRERETLLVDGAWSDDVVMGILETDYRSLADRPG